MVHSSAPRGQADMSEDVRLLPARRHRSIARINVVTTGGLTREIVVAKGCQALLVFVSVAAFPCG